MPVICLLYFNKMDILVLKGKVWIIILSSLVSFTSSFAVMNLNTTINSNLPFYCQYCRCTMDGNNIRIDCFAVGLFHPPRNISFDTTELYLRKNRIPAGLYKHYANLTKLRILDLSSNAIKTIEVGAFKDLVSLTELYLHGNSFKAYGEAIQPGAFLGLGNLKLLTLHNCITRWMVTLAINIPWIPFKDLVGLEILSVDGYRNVKFTEEFKALKSLTTLTISGVHGACSIKNLGRFSFVGVPHLKNLILEKCDLESVESDTFYALSNLTVLDLSNNVNLGFTGLGNIYLQSTNLTVLKINSIHAPYRAGSEILRENMRNIRNTKTLRVIDMEANGLEYIDYGVFDLLPKSLEYISMKNNRLHFGFYMYEAVFNTNLKVFDAGSQHPAIQDDEAFRNLYTGFISKMRRRRSTEVHKVSASLSNKIHSEIEIETVFDLNVPLSNSNGNFKITNDRNTARQLSIDRFHAHGNKHKSEINPILDRSFRHRRKRNAHEKGYTTVRTLICSGSMSRIMMIDFNNTENNITHVDFSKNFMQNIKTDSFVGLDKVRYLNLAENYIEAVQRDGFQGLKSLQTLYLQNNLLGFRLSTDQDGEMFSHLPNVVHLNLSLNRIVTLNRHVFRGLESLEILDLSSNYLYDFNTDVTNLKRLQLLNVSYNHIKHLDGDMRESLNKIGKRSNFAIDFSANNFMCTCETLPFLRWFNSAPIDFVNKDQYYCSLNNGTIRSFNSSDELVLLLEEECASYIGIIVFCSVSGSFLASLTLFFVLYRQRWRLLYLYYMAKAKLDVTKDMDETDIRFQYDIFVSYGDGDRMFVIKEMLEHLETNAGLKLNIRDRDFDVGEIVAVNISKAVRTSKRTFLLLSRHFLKSKWCNFEMNMARMEALHMKRKVIVLVFLDNIPNDLLPLELLDLLRDCPSIQFPKDDFDREVFWQKCKELVLM